MINEFERKALVEEVRIKINELRSRWLSKNTNHPKANGLVKVCNALIDLEIPFATPDAPKNVNFSNVTRAIEEVRSDYKAQVFRFGNVGKFFAGLCMFSTKPHTKTDLLLDKISNTLNR